MRVISGKFRGRKLNTLAGNSVRPTSDKIKEAVFSIIQFEIEGVRFLDLFAGSGQMGIEAISRGAREVVFVDSRRDSISVVNQNLNLLKLKDNVSVVNCDSLLFLKKTDEHFDVVYIDPPYATDLLESSLEIMDSVMNKENGIVICESPADKELPSAIKGFPNVKKYRYGKICVAVYRRDNQEN